MATQVRCSKENSHVPHCRNDHQSKLLDILEIICSLLGVTAGGVTMQVKCSKEESHISNHRGNDHTGEVLDLINDTTRNRVCGIVVDLLLVVKLTLLLDIGRRTIFYIIYVRHLDPGTKTGAGKHA